MTKILILAYYWPPSASIASHRWLHMSRYLSKMGFEVSVMVPQGADYVMIDEKQLSFVGEEVKIINEPIWEVRKIFSRLIKSKNNKTDNIFFKKKEQLTIKERISLWIRANVFVPDARVSWYHQIKNRVVTLIKNENIDLIITTGPPHSVHLNGLYAKSKTNVKWMADFRDPWTTIEYHSKLPLTISAAKRHRKLEKEVVNIADTVLTVSPTWVTELKALGNQNVELIYNGYEESLFKDIESKKETSKFVIAHMGTLKADRNPEALWRAISEIGLSSSEIEIALYGMVTEEVKASIKKYNLEDITTFNGNVSHKEAIQAMIDSDLLLLLVNKSEVNSAGRIPAKIFEYLRSGNDILLIGNTKGDAAAIINDQNAGQSINYSDVDSAKEAVIFSIENIRQERFKNNDKFSREQQAHLLVPIIKSLIA